MQYQYDLGFIGCGNMARAIMAGLAAGQDGLSVAATDVNPACAQAVPAAFLPSGRVLAERCRYILFAVKPYHAQAVFEEIRPVLTPGQCVISIMAGVPSDRLTRELAPVARVARVMPNLAAKVREAMSALCFTPACTAADRALVQRIFDSVGRTVEVDEALLHAVTALSGSGTAYVYEMIKHMAAAGEKLGLDADTALQLTLQTVRGAAAMVASSRQPLDDMIAAVCSKGGTTIEAIDTLRERGFGEIVEAAMRACYDRSLAMSRES